MLASLARSSYICSHTLELLASNPLLLEIFFSKKEKDKEKEKKKEKISTRRPGGRGVESLGRKSWRKKLASTQTKKMQQHINRIAIVATGYSETQFPRKIDRRNHE